MAGNRDCDRFPMGTRRQEVGLSFASRTEAHMKRRRFGQPTSLEEQLLQEAEQVRKQAERLPPGEDRDLLLEDRELLLKKARVAAHIDEG